MKKILSMILALALLCAACCALAEDAPLFATIGDALDAAGENPIGCGDAEHYVVALEKDGKYLRAVANLDDNAKALGEALGTTDDFEAEFAAYEAALRALPVAYVEEFTVQPKTQEELDALVGKTIGELEDADFAVTESGTEENTVTFVLADGVFQYAFGVDASVNDYESRQDSGNYSDMVTNSVKFAGLSMYAGDLQYKADGTYEEAAVPEEDAALMAEIENIVAAVQSGEEVDIDALVDVLIEKFPEEEQTIRDLVDFAKLMNGAGVPETGAEAE